MKKLCLSLFFIVWTVSGYAQREADAMYFGGCFGGGCWCNPPVQGNVFKFNEDSLIGFTDPACMPLSTFFSKAAFSDRNTGELLFASNGWRLINGLGVILAHKLWRDDVSHPGDSSDTTRVNYAAGPLFLNHPTDSSKVYLFYGQRSAPFFQGQYLTAADIYFTYALIDIPTQSLISKNNIVLSDTSSMGDMQACRHANGRDWWIIKPHIFTDLYYVGLLDPTGISMNLVQLPDVPHLLRSNTSSKFNIQGNKYIQYIGQPHRQVHEYDFDRCSGLLSNFRPHDLSDSIANNDLIATLSISPNGSKFYIKRNNTLLQGGTDQGLFQVDLATDEMRLIARYGGTSQMMPNGKKMIFGEYFFDENNVIQRRISEISNPNANFNELDIQHFKYNILNPNMGVAPSNFAYFRLGAEAGSGCDSLGLSANAVEDLPEISVFPNPNNGVVQLRLAQWPGGSYSLHNSLGLQVAQATLPVTSYEQIFTLAFQHLPAGLYFLSLHNPQGQMLGSKRLIIMRQ